MKIIDEKGRLFGKVNVIDFTVFLFVTVLISMAYFGYKNAIKKPVAEIETAIVELSCKIVRLDPQIEKLIALGDKELNSQGQEVGWVIGIGESRPYQYTIDMGSGQTEIIEHPFFKELPIKIKLAAQALQNKLYHQGQQVVINYPFNFKTAKYTIPVIPVSTAAEKWVRIEVRFPALSTELSSAIKKGDMEKDSMGRLICRLEEIISNVLSQISAMKLMTNELVFISDPQRNDIVASVDILCTEKQGGLFFKNYPIRIGNQISFNLELYVVSGVITSIEK